MILNRLDQLLFVNGTKPLDEPYFTLDDCVTMLNIMNILDMDRLIWPITMLLL